MQTVSVTLSELITQAPNTKLPEAPSPHPHPPPPTRLPSGPASPSMAAASATVLIARERGGLEKSAVLLGYRLAASGRDQQAAAARF